MRFRRVLGFRPGIPAAPPRRAICPPVCSSAYAWVTENPVFLLEFFGKHLNQG